MITCILEISEDVEDLHKIFLAEKLESDRAKCEIRKNKTLIFEVTAKDPVSMRAFTSSILKIIETYQKISK